MVTILPTTQKCNICTGNRKKNLTAQFTNNDSLLKLSKNKLFTYILLEADILIYTVRQQMRKYKQKCISLLVNFSENI